MYSGAGVLGYWIDLDSALFKCLKIFENLFLNYSSACEFYMLLASSRYFGCIFVRHREF
jgi:hypothetical protein